MDILVVDDSASICAYLQNLLVSIGHNVEVAIDGEAAWQKIHEQRFQVIISDWVMPNMDGIELTCKIRNADFGNYLYIILLTGKSEHDDLITGIEAGADDFANKPLDLKELRIRLRSAQRIVDLEASLASKNAQLESAHNAIRQDLENAAVTQKNALPAPLKHDHITATWLYHPAVFVGGDAFNYFFSASGLFLFLNVDISGHGVSPALMSMSLQSMVAHQKGLYGGTISREKAALIPKTFANNLNQMILNNNIDHYLTMIFGVIDFSSKDLYFVQCGHPHPFYYDSQHDDLKELEITGYPVGLLDSVEYETQHIKIASKDKFILYSDGVAEVKSSIDGKPLDTKNLHRHLNNIKQFSADRLICHITDFWLCDGQIDSPEDDVNLLIFEFM